MSKPKIKRFGNAAHFSKVEAIGRVGYKCKHIAKDEIGGDCVHCNLIVAEKVVKSLQEAQKKYKVKYGLAVDEIKTLKRELYLTTKAYESEKELCMKMIEERDKFKREVEAQQICYETANHKSSGRNPCKKYVGPKNGKKACERCGWSFNAHKSVGRKKVWETKP